MSKPFILCAEDNENDIQLMKRVFNLKLKDFSPVFHTNVDDCKKFLNDAFSKNELPILALVDIKLINSNGLDLLKYLKEDPRFMEMPVIMLSSSDRQDDKKRAKEFRCNDYVEKPRSYLELKSKLPEIIYAWS